MREQSYRMEIMLCVLAIVAAICLAGTTGEPPRLVKSTPASQVASNIHHR